MFAPNAVYVSGSTQTHSTRPSLTSLNPSLLREQDSPDRDSSVFVRRSLDATRWRSERGHGVQALVRRCPNRGARVQEITRCKYELRSFVTALGAHKHSKASAHRRFVAVFLLLGLGLSLSSCRQAHRTHMRYRRVGHVDECMGAQLQPFPNALWLTRAGIYEPMMIFNTLSGQYVLWLATSYRWITEGQEVEFSIRKDVRWNDGAPLSAEDVAFTFKLLKQHPALDTNGVWSRLESAVQLDRVSFALSSRTSTTTAPSVAGSSNGGTKNMCGRMWKSPTSLSTRPLWHPTLYRGKDFSNTALRIGPESALLARHQDHAEDAAAYAHAGNDTVSLAFDQGILIGPAMPFPGSKRPTSIEILNTFNTGSHRWVAWYFCTPTRPQRHSGRCRAPRSQPRD